MRVIFFAPDHFFKLFARAHRLVGVHVADRLRGV